MEDDRFDNLSKKLASTRSRRDVLRMLGGTAAAGIAAAVAAPVASARRGPKCKPIGHHCGTDKQCCTGFCNRNTHLCSPRSVGDCQICSSSLCQQNSDCTSAGGASCNFCCNDPELCNPPFVCYAC